LEEGGLATTKSLDNIKASEKLYEIIQLASEDLLAVQEYEEARAKGMRLDSPQRNPLLQAYAHGLTQGGGKGGEIRAELIVLKMVERIRVADLEQALLLLPIATIIAFLPIIQTWITNVRGDPYDGISDCRLKYFLFLKYIGMECQFKHKNYYVYTQTSWRTAAASETPQSYPGRHTCDRKSKFARRKRHDWI
jgi:hypothetical protein